MRQKASTSYRVTIAIRGVAIFVFLFVIWSLSKNLFELTRLDERLIRAQEEITILKQENQQLQDQAASLDEYDYKEAAIRNKLGLVLPGETVVIVPGLDLASSTKETSSSANLDLYRQKPIWQQWLRLFL